MFNIALYKPDIPQNTAAIIRLCSCFDVTLEIIEPCGFHLEDKRLKKVAMDYLDKSKIVTYKSYESFLFKKKNSRVILMTTKAEKNYHNFKFETKDTISSFQGLSVFVLKYAEIPNKKIEMQEIIFNKNEFSISLFI